MSAVARSVAPNDAPSVSFAGAEAELLGGVAYPTPDLAVVVAGFERSADMDDVDAFEAVSGLHFAVDASGAPFGKGVAVALQGVIRDRFSRLDLGWEELPRVGPVLAPGAVLAVPAFGQVKYRSQADREGVDLDLARLA